MGGSEVAMVMGAWVMGADCDVACSEPEVV